MENHHILGVTKQFIKNILQKFFMQSLQSAAREQKMPSLAMKLEGIVPDITNQYSSFQVSSPYQKIKVRFQHVFQIMLVDKAINEFERPVIVDIGDSSGTHLQYLAGLYPEKRGMRCLSVNLDLAAVERIKKKGLDVVLARAEDLEQYNIHADIFLCFETLEHLTNPVFFLHELSSKTEAKYLIITVPYLRKSRVGLHHIRGKANTQANPENTHIFELSPEDWRLLMQHSGWVVSYEQIYLQYPKWGFLRLLQPVWRRLDFEGFYGVILKRDTYWSQQYNGW